MYWLYLALDIYLKGIVVAGAIYGVACWGPPAKAKLTIGPTPPWYMIALGFMPYDVVYFHKFWLWFAFTALWPIVAPTQIYQAWEGRK